MQNGFRLTIFEATKPTGNMHYKYLVHICVFALTGLIVSCNKDDNGNSNTTPTTTGGYTGSGSVTQGVGTSTTGNLFAAGQRVASIGTITSTDGKKWTVPAEVNFTNSLFPMASDLHNGYVPGHNYSNATQAVAGLSGSDIVTIDADGEVYTTYIFADNYFEMYVNGIPVGKDPVPYTDFNSCIVRFTAKKPFTLAVKCVDWEENLGIGTESNNGNSYHIGDGGFVAVIKDATGNIVVVTDNSWKAQTYYTSPIANLDCVTESGNVRSSTGCNTSAGTASSYGIHWVIPDNWYDIGYDDSNWPAATTFTNATVGVDNKSSYTNFTNIFDNSAQDASFIWSTNLLLDNVVLLRKKVE